MIDFIRILNLHMDPSQLLGNNLLMFPKVYDPNTGEDLNKKRYAFYRGMKFIITPRGISSMQGSLHKYFNSGQHNHNDFNMANIINVIHDLFRNFNIDPRKVTLNHVEVGVNIEFPYCPDEFINQLVTHKYQQFNIENSNKMTLANVRYQQFEVKIYNKGLQYSLDKNILRFEVRVIKMALLMKYGIQTLWDLINSTKLDLLRELLLDTFNDLTYWDESIVLDSLSKAERKLLQNGRNPKFWKEHLALTKSNASRDFRKYQELVNKYGSKHFYEIAKLINSKWDQLLCLTDETKHILKSFQEELEVQKVRVLTENQKVPETSDIRVLTEKGDLVNDDSYMNEIRLYKTLSTSINNLNIGGKLVSQRKNEKVCIVTGIDISMQKESSRFLSITGIKYLYHNNPCLFKSLQSWLTKKWLNYPIDKQIIEIAHKIRRTHYHPKYYNHNAIKRLCCTPALFNNYDLISPSKRRIAEQL